MRAGLVDEMAAQPAHEEVGGQHQRHAHRQHPQRLDRVVGHHAVVDVHGEHRQREREQVHEQRRPEHVAVDEALAQQRTPEPVLAGRGAHFGRAGVEAEMRADVERDAGVARGEVVAGECHGALAGLGQQDAGFGACAVVGVIPAEQHAGFVALQDEDGGQRGGIDRVERAALQPGGHAGARRGAFGEFKRKPAVRRARERQAGGERRPRSRLAMQPAHLDQAVEQRVGVDQVFAQALHRGRRAGCGSGQGSGGGGRRVGHGRARGRAVKWARWHPVDDRAAVHHACFGMPDASTSAMPVGFPSERALVGANRFQPMSAQYRSKRPVRRSSK